MTLEFFDEPPPPPRRGRWVRVANELRANPGKWAKVVEGASRPSQTAYFMTRGKYIGFEPAGHFQAMTREGDVWARFVGES